MLFHFHHDVRFPVLARNLSRNAINRHNVSVTNTSVKTEIGKFASLSIFRRGGSSVALKYQADMNSFANLAHSARKISNPEPSARYDLG